MNYNILKTSEEELLLEVINAKKTSDNDFGYWQKRVKEDESLGQLFCVLEEKGLVSINWIEDTPLYIKILENGENYFLNKKEHEENIKNEKTNKKKYFLYGLILGLIIGLIPYLIWVL